MSNSDTSSDDDITLPTAKRRRKCEVEENSLETITEKTDPPQKESSLEEINDDEGPNSDSEEEESAIKAQENETNDAFGSESDSNDDASGNNENDKKNSKKRKRSSSFDEKSESSSVDSEDEDDEKEQATIMKKKKIEKQIKNRSNEDSSKIIRLKRYLKVAGIRIRNYSKLFEGCKSKKSKEAKLLELLENEGLKGKPTLEKCKKLRKKIETQREVAELDLGNIIDGNDNLTTRGSRTTRNRMRSTEIGKEKVSHRQEEINPFGNLSGIIDAEESDENEGKATMKPKKKKQKFIESDEASGESGIEGDAIDALSASPVSN